MPTLPRYSSQRQLRAPQAVSAAPVLRQIGETALDIAVMGERREIAKLEFDTRMELAEQKNQIDTAKINTQNQLALFQEEQKANPMALKPQEIEDGITKIIGENTSGIESFSAQQTFERDISGIATRYGIQARGIRNTAVINTGKQNTIAGIEAIAGDTNRLLKLSTEVIDPAVALGFYSPEEGQNLKSEAVKSWALNDANQGAGAARSVLESLKTNDGRYPLDAEESNAAFSDVKSVLSRLEYTEKVETAGAGVLVQQEYTDIIARTDIEVYQKYAAIKNMALQPKQEKQALAVLNTAEGIAPFTDTRMLALLGAEIDSFNKVFGTEGAAEEPDKYFKRVQRFRDKVDQAYINKKLSPESYTILLDDISKSTDVKTLQAAGSLKNNDNWSDWRYENSDAIADFGIAFDEDPILSSRLFSDYYLQKSDPDFKNTRGNRQQLVADLVEKEKASQRTEAQKVVMRYGAAVSKQTMTAEQFMGSRGFSEKDIKQTMLEENMSREEVLKALGHNG
jgi:hypothetical protein